MVSTTRQGNVLVPVNSTEPAQASAPARNACQCAWMVPIQSVVSESINSRNSKRAWAAPMLRASAGRGGGAGTRVARYSVARRESASRSGPKELSARTISTGNGQVNASAAILARSASTSFTRPAVGMTTLIPSLAGIYQRGHVRHGAAEGFGRHDAAQQL